MAHHCTTLVLHCIDFRFGKAIKEYLEQNGLLGNCDIVSVAGAAKNLVSPKESSDQEFVVRQIETSKRLHNIKEVILMNHTDCGAYGGKAAFVSPEEEKKKHRTDMEAAATLIRKDHPEIKTKTVLATIDNAGKVTFEE